MTAIRNRPTAPSSGPQRTSTTAATAPTRAAPAGASNADAATPTSTRLIPPETRNQPGELMVMQYNVENLFDTRDDPTTQDEDFTPDGKEHWNDAKLAAKLQNLGRVVRHVNGGQGPEVLALEEVENKEVLEQLRSGALRGLGYREPVLIEGKDERGIDVALLTRYPLKGQPRIHDPQTASWRGPSRPILEVPLDVDGRELTVFVNHWPSKGGGEAAEHERGEAAARVRSLVADKLKQDPDAEILVVGDLNADLGEAALGRDLGSTDDKAAVVASSAEAPQLFDAMHDAARIKPAAPLPAADEPPADLAAELSARRAVLATAERPRGPSGDPRAPDRVGTHYYKPDRSWSTLDHVMLSRGLLDGAGLSYVPGSAQVVNPDFMRNRDGSPRRFLPPPRRDASPEDAARLPPAQSLGYSDHFPVVVRFKRVSGAED